jgi:hypothetical protein
MTPRIAAVHVLSSRRRADRAVEIQSHRRL